MTNAQAGEILSEIMPGFWPEWECTDTQTASWMKKLRGFDFEKAKKVIEDMHFTREGKYKNPPARVLLEKLEARAVESPFAPHEREPLLLYEIIAEGYTRGMKFYMPNGRPPSQQDVEREAEFKRDKLTQLRQREHIIHYANWEAELDYRAHIEEEQSLRVMTADDKLRVQLELLDGPDRPGKKFMQWYLSDERKRDRKTGHIKEAIKI